MSDAFNTYASLKYRLALAEVHVEINEPRGRYVKTVVIYFSPRPILDVAMLKSAEFTPLWQECGRIPLEKGAARASLILEKSVLAANIRIEYAEFYERTGSTKSSDGSFVLHCPRCNRAVNNAHGVCGNCGEVALQCRKCRKINYDRLDGFLCIECGYCSSVSSFAFELTAAIASNAVAITNDDDFERSRSMFAVSKRLHEDLRSALLEQLAALPRASNDASIGATGLDVPSSWSITDTDKFSLTLATLGKQGSVIKAVARADDSVFESRSHSLLRLTREWRDSNTSLEGRQVSSILNELGRDMHRDDDESADELICLLESSVAGRGNNDDVVNRLLSSVQNRRQRRADAAEASSGGGATVGGPGPATLGEAKAKLEMCDRLFVLMKEAERECHLLEARILAWQRLDTGTLMPSDSRAEGQGASFEPSHCSTCSNHIALHLLQLWQTMLETAPETVEINQEMVHLLLMESIPLQRNLVDLKRQVVQSIALRSRTGGSVIVLAALRAHLMADPDSSKCTEILSKIIEGGGSEEFSNLSMEVLEASASMELTYY